jgi:hypothetical protein
LKERDIADTKTDATTQEEDRQGAPGQTNAKEMRVKSQKHGGKSQAPKVCGGSSEQPRGPIAAYG